MIDMGVMTPEQLEESREDLKRRREAEKNRQNLSSYSPRQYTPYVWTEKRIRERSK
jgi:hypothetical protein